MKDKDSFLSTDRFKNPEFAKRYAARHLKMSMNIANKITIKLYEKNFKQGRILDSGCGPGFIIIELAKRFNSSEFYGIDLSDPLLEIANEKNKKTGLIERVKFIKADVLSVPFPDNYFDFVININMLHLVEDPVKMLNEIERILKPGGFFYITDLRKSILGLLEKEIKSALTIKGANGLISNSNLTEGNYSSDLVWWVYQNI